jgi:dTDP-4-amino-4,6-dideoxygalactose transaminase
LCGVKHTTPSECAGETSPSPARPDPLPLEFPGAHFMDEEEVQAAERVLRARSPFRYYGLETPVEVDGLEKELASFTGRRHALAVTSGTGALHVSLAALGVGPGQEVIVPAYMWVSVAGAVVNRGAIPVLADIDNSFCITRQTVERVLTPRTSGIIFVHMSGAPGAVEGVADLSRERGLFLLEDCAQCLGGTIRGRSAGTFGDMAVFSFQLNKNMTAGEGGCVVTDDDRLFQRAFACHDLGYARDGSGRLIFDNPDLSLWGMGYRLDEVRAAVLRVQLRKLPDILAAMRGSKGRIRKGIEGTPGIALRKLVDPAGDTGCFLILTLPDAERARHFQSRLRDEGLRTYPQGVSNIVMTEWGLHLYYNIASLVNRTSADPGGWPWSHPANAPCLQRYDKGACPQADDLFARSVLLPVPSCLTRADEQEICEAILRAARS